MVKKVVITSAVIVITLAICFIGIYGFMLAYCSDIEDYSEDILGTWCSVQYSAGGKTVACKDDPVAELTVTGTVLKLNCNDDFPSFEVPYSGLSGKALQITEEGQTYTLYFEFNSRGQMRLTINEINVVFVLDNVNNK